MIDNATIERARKTDVVAFLENRYGYKFTYRNGAYRCEQHQSLVINNNRLSWYWHSKGVGGYGVLDYLMKEEKMPFVEAVEAVTGVVQISERPQPQRVTKKRLEMPQLKATPLRAYEYLCEKRGISRNIVIDLCLEQRLFQDVRGNVVFVGYDEKKKPRFASLRGTYGDCSFRGDCAGSDKRYGFSMEASGKDSQRLYVFESPIDAMSHASLENIRCGESEAWRKDYRLSLAGTSDTAMQYYLEQHTNVKEIVFCLDNDQAGNEAADRMMEKYRERGYVVNRNMPNGKDFNEDLQSHAKRNREANVEWRGR